jgi:hypothetical protein
MKKEILFFLTFFLFISIFAQESDHSPTQSEGAKKGQSNFRGGIRAGFTGSQITGDGFPFQGFNKFGGFGGVFVNYPVSRNGKWLIQPELNFIMKGCKHTPKYDEYGIPIGTGNSYRLQLMYGQIPVLAKWRFYKGLELEFGPGFGILFKNSNVEEINGYPEKGRPQFFRFEFSGIVGLDYLFRNHWGVSLRFEASLLPVRKASYKDWLFLNRGQYNQTIAFSVYYQF